MKLQKNQLAGVAGYGALLILLYWGLQNLDRLTGWGRMVFQLFWPFLLGLIIAFLLNVPMHHLERALFKNAKGRVRSLARPLSLVLTILLVVGLLFVVLFLVLPELATSVTLLGNSIPGYIEKASQQVIYLSQQYPEIAQSLSTLSINWDSMIQSGIKMVETGVTAILNSTVSVVSGVFSGVLSFLLAVVFAIYLLLQKESLRDQLVQVLHAFVPEPRAKRVLYVASLTHRTFVSFISGQCLEAVILGLMFFVTLSVFRIDYALMISVLTGFTALIPVFGAFIGCAVGTFLILMVNPMQALWFLIIFIVLQQVEGNLIYPKVVGGSIGLPAIWVLLAVTVGGSAMGIAGMLLFIPLCSVFHALLWEAVAKRKGSQSAPEEVTHEETT